MRKDKRGWSRLITSTLVHFVSDRDDWVGNLTDISSGGMQCGIYSRPAGEIGQDDPFHCVFVLPTGKVEGDCSIEWINLEKQLVGVSFTHVDPASREVIENYCQSPF